MRKANNLLRVMPLVLMVAFMLGLLNAPAKTVSARAFPGNAPAQTIPIPPAAAADIPTPLPDDCDGVAPDSLCCASGYVYDRYAPVTGATVTIQSAEGSVGVMTQAGDLSGDPYFQIDLNAAPLNVSPGETITLIATYNGETHTHTYRVQEGGQQVDMALPTSASDTPIYYVSGSESNRQIWRMDSDGNNRVYIRNGSDPDICPANGRVLYIDGGDIHVMDINGSYIANLSAGGYADYNPDWSPDCSQIVYASATDGWRYRLYKMNSDGSGKTQLPSPAGAADDWYPEWSPDGQWIAFTSEDGNRDDYIYRMRPDGSGISRLTHDSWFPVWSPDSSRIAYVANYGDGEDIYVMNSDGANVQRVTNEPRPWWPYWYDDERLMYVMGDDVYQGTHLDIFLINADGTGKTNLSNDGNSYYRTPTVRPTYLPVATIHSITPNPAIQGLDTIAFRGSGQDRDEGGESITAYRWVSSLDGELNDQAEFSLQAAVLSLGVHTITFQVQDDEGRWSPAVTRTLTVSADEQQDVKTLILTNYQKLVNLYGTVDADLVIGRLNNLAAYASVEGVILLVENDSAVAVAYAAWDANPTSTTQANAAAGAIKNLIDTQWASHPNLEYLVIVGDDRVIPFRRVLDQTRNPESYYDSVSCSSVTGAALCKDMTLTDDYYADAVPTIPADSDWDGHALYIPDLGVGRLIETPAEIIAQVDAFLSGSEVTANTAIVTGYDFLTDGAQAVCRVLKRDGLITDCSLIGENWGRGDFVSKVLDMRHTFASMNGHANHYLICTPSGCVTSTDFSGASADLARSLFYTVGCHAGLNVPPTNPYQPLDIAQSLAGRQANYVANTGYGWGFRASVGLSEQLMLDFTEQLVFGQSAAVGQSLASAKQEYYLNESGFDYYDEKIMIESTLYGLPMMRYTTPAAAGQVSSHPTSLAAELWSTLDGGLTVYNVTYQFPALLAETTEYGQVYTYGGAAHTGDGEPVQPKTVEDLTFPGLAVHGVVFRGGIYADVADFNPVVEQAFTETAPISETVFSAPGWYPSLLHSFNRLGQHDRLVMLLGQFNAQTQTERLYDELSFDVYYHADSSDWEAPYISCMVSERVANTAAVAIHATDASGIEAVVVAYTDGNGVWESVSLIGSGGMWTGTFPASAETVFFIQTVDGTGNVAACDNAGMYFQPGDSFATNIYLPIIVRTP